jgi:polyhydroxyalkanoate synthesis regulator phasin
MSTEEAKAFMDALVASVAPSHMTIEEALGRSRLDRF